MHIYITAIIKSKPAHQEEVYSVLQNMVRETRKEQACLLYDLHQDLKDENQFIFYEIWENEEGLHLHNQQNYIKEFGYIVSEKLQETPQIYLTRKMPYN
ncbi:antibiotic biosynthesis monooxygenase [Empedobacter brevis]|uniref:Antibiotic biosynthesis monooxygenase n=1 Tax=Empedobacter brevis TaxID=247 RepID=A0AAJ1QC39_9FLAO|nr:putative quinol monooxygenase [Empedobacter brevis]MDM1071187.1 antibiotic biosynthesis monooxygenase [Empedobacter brevis]QHC85359.1 antibiotic biosynthesis monooxygenase [Empedobacter brevis]